MSGYSQGTFTPTNPQKYIGVGSPVFRSGWEQTFMLVLDKHPNVIQWASESIKIPYFNPLTQKWANYIPDFLIVTVDATGTQKAEMIEIKPLKEAVLEKAKSKKDKLAYAVNEAKWTAAIEWCAKAKITFRVLTEDQLFRRPGQK